MTIAPRVMLPLYRGTSEHANCGECPFSVQGEPNKPVYGEGPEDPMWIIIGEGPGVFETRQGRPFVGPSGSVVNKMLAKVARPRDQVWVTNATLCIPPQGSPDTERQRAAECCKPRLVAELAQFPGKPILTLGAVAARSVIPKEALDAVDPPDAPKAIRKQQKFRQQPTLKAAAARRRAISKEAQRRLKKMIAHHRKVIITTIKVKHKRKPDRRYLEQEIARVQARLELKAREDAIKAVDAKIKERAFAKIAKAKQPKKRKAKPVKITDICGTLFDVDVDGTGIRPLIPAIHPAALLRGGGASIGGSHTPDMAYVNLCADALKVDALAQGKDIRLHLDIEHELVDQVKAVRLFVDVYHDALEEDACSLDLETYVDDPDRHHALMAYVARIKVIGLSTKKRSISVAWELLPSWCQSLLQRLMAQVEMTYHNGLYDRTVLRAHGFIMGPRWFDTLLAHHAAFPGNSHRLQVVASQFYGVQPWKSEYRNQEETNESLAIYNAKDTGATHALRAPLTVWVKRTKTDRVYDLDKKMSDVASRMHLAGMPVDRDVNNELLATFSKSVKESREHVEAIARDPKLREQIWHHLAISQANKKRKLDPDDFEERYNIRLSAMKLDPDWRWKINAGKHIAALLQAMGVGLYQTTASGEISTQKDILEGLVNVPIVRDILEYRESDKLYSTFVYPLFDRYVNNEIVSHGFADGNDRIHSIWNVHRISGRWASQWPVVSNVPKSKWKKLTETEIETAKLVAIALGVELDTLVKPWQVPDGALIRVNKDKSISKMVRPNLRRQIRARPGRKLVGFDFGQIEARVIALISGDPFLCTIFAEGRDPHIECSRIIWPHFDSLDPDTRKQLRENVKNIEYGAMYMAQLEKLHQTMLKAGNYIRIEDLAVALSKLLKAMAGVVRWQHETVAKASMPPFEIADFVLGRRRCWPMGQVEGPEAVNYGVQTAAAAIMNQGMSRMADRLDNYRQLDPIAQIHDAAVFECWEEDAESVSRDIKECFETEIERDGRKIPFPVDCRIGDDWSEL
jgi:uracil-DNA glycosylase family 4